MYFYYTAELNLLILSQDFHNLFISERVLHLIVCVYGCVYVTDCELCSYLLMGTLIVKLMKLDFQNFPYVNIFQIPLPNFVFKIVYSLFF